MNKKFIMKILFFMIMIGLLASTVTASTELIDVDRDTGDRIVEPNETIEVELSFYIENQTNLDFAEKINQRGVAEVNEMRFDHENNGTLDREMEMWGENGGALLIDEISPGNWTASYTITIDEDTEPGTRINFTGAAQIGGASIENQESMTDQFTGDESIVVSGEDSESNTRVVSVGSSTNEDNQIIVVMIGIIIGSVLFYLVRSHRDRQNYMN